MHKHEQTQGAAVLAPQTAIAAATESLIEAAATAHSGLMTAELAEEAPAAADPNTHTLDTPLVRGSGKPITAITLRKPASGELRGVSLSDLVSLDVAALAKVLPRISSPTLTEQDVARLDPADLVQLGGIFAGFLMPKAVKASMASLTA
jgi:hypothetical protein